MVELLQKAKAPEASVFPKPGSKLATLSDMYRLHTLRNKLLEDGKLNYDPNINSIVRTMRDKPYKSLNLKPSEPYPLVEMLDSQLFFKVKGAVEHFLVDNVIHKGLRQDGDDSLHHIYLGAYVEFQDYENNRIWFQREVKGKIIMQAEVHVLKWTAAIDYRDDIACKDESYSMAHLYGVLRRIYFPATFSTL